MCRLLPEMQEDLRQMDGMSTFLKRTPRATAPVFADLPQAASFSRSAPPRTPQTAPPRGVVGKVRFDVSPREGEAADEVRSGSATAVEMRGTRVAAV